MPHAVQETPICFNQEGSGEAAEGYEVLMQQLTARLQRNSILRRCSRP